MNETLKLAFSSIIAALSVALLFLTSVIPVGTYAAPCIVGMLLCFVVIEAGYPAAFSVYAVVSVLSFLLSGDKEAVLYYAAFFGLYPILKGLVERIGKVWLQYIVKYCIFNVLMVIAFYISISVLMIPKESFEVFGVYLPWAFLLAGNLIFILYDLSVTRIIMLYVEKWRKLLKIRK